MTAYPKKKHMLSLGSAALARRLIQKSGEPTADQRHSPTVLEWRRTARAALKRLISGSEELLALVWAWGCGCGLTAIGQPMFYFVSGWPEAHWRVPESEWESLPLEEKATLEAREQALKHVAGEYHGKWLESYAPAEADAVWWDEGGHKLSLEGKLSRLERMYRQRVSKIRKEYLGYLG